MLQNSKPTWFNESDESDAIRKRVYCLLRDELNKGAFDPGTTFSLKQVREKLGAGKTPVRDAIIQLEAQGVVTITPRSGFKVNMMNLDDLGYLFETVGALESAVFTRVYDCIGESHIKALEVANAEMRVSAACGEIAEFNNSFVDFHCTFFDLAENDFADWLISQITLKMCLFTGGALDSKWMMFVCDENQNFLNLLKEDNQKKAADHIRKKVWNFKLHKKYFSKSFSVANAVKPSVSYLDNRKRNWR